MAGLAERMTSGVAGQILKYLVVGGSAFVIDFGLLVLLKSGVGLPAWLSAAVAFAVSTLYSFLLQRKVTFSADLHVGHSAFRYGILLAANMLLTAGIVEAFDQYLDMYVIGKVVSTILTMLWNFPLMKYWVYPRQTAAAEADAVEADAD